MTGDIYDAVAAEVGSRAQHPVAFYGIDFTPPDEGIYLQVVPFYNDNKDYFQVSVARGFFRINAIDKVGHGPMPALEMAEQIASWFPRGSQWGGATITGSAGIGGPIQDSDRLIVPVTFRWMKPRQPAG